MCCLRLVPSANLQGALGKISGRSYKAAPRQLLQVSNSENGEDAAKEVAKQGRETLAHATLVMTASASFHFCLQLLMRTNRHSEGSTNIYRSGKHYY